MTGVRCAVGGLGEVAQPFEVDALVVGMLAVPAPTPLLSHRSVPPLIAVVAIIATAILPVAIFPVAIFTVAHPTTPAE